MAMVHDLLAFSAVTAVALLPLVWRVWRDRAVERALLVRADVHAAVRRVLGGDSFIGVEVTPGLLGRHGEIILSAPTGWEDILQLALPSVLARVPPRYQLVVRPGPRLAPHCAGEPRVAAAVA
jgi:hypothetical protein